MSQILIALSVWLHALATVVFIGHYVLLAAIYLPMFEQKETGDERGRILGEISQQGCHTVPGGSLP